MKTRRPKDLPPASAPAADDTFLVDDGASPTRALATQYVPNTFAGSAATKPLVAGPGIALADTPEGILIIAL